jgi:DNA-binding response OmpR family regulator
VGDDTKRVVLVVDDEPAIRLLCRVNLELAGYEVREAGTLGQAREALGDDVAIVLLDMHIGSERGETLLDELREKGIPAVVVTGSTDVESVSGLADAVLVKPFRIEELESTVGRLTGRGAVG